MVEALHLALMTVTLAHSVILLREQEKYQRPGTRHQRRNGEFEVVA
jgi:hypothetical protein